MKKVLILEDEVNIRSFVVINLKRAGYDAIEAATGQEALDMIYEHTLGYPYFLQEWGYQVWNQAAGALLTKQDVLAASDLVIRRLDQNFFRVRYDRLTESEKRFMRAMAELDAGESRCSEIAPLLGMKPTALTPTRANLIRKGMIYSPRHGVIDYSVPLFGEFLRRVMPQLPPS